MTHIALQEALDGKVVDLMTLKKLRKKLLTRLRGVLYSAESPRYTFIVRETGSPMIPQKYILKLRNELAAPLLESGDPGYDQSLVIDNGRIDFRPRIQAHSSTRKEGKNYG